MIKCIINKCLAFEDECEFINGICINCYDMITTGDVTKSDNFISELNDVMLKFMESAQQFSDMSFEQSLILKELKPIIESQQAAMELTKKYLEQQVLKEMDDYQTKTIN